MNYTWYIQKLGIKDVTNNEGTVLQKCIVDIKWKRIAEDTDGTTASFVGNTELNTKEINQEDFIAFNQVTPSLAIQWIENSMTQKVLNRIDQQLEKKIEKNRLLKVNPTWN